MTTQSKPGNDLTKGKIFGPLVRLALPIAGVQVMHMAYNLNDMFWLGRLCIDALAASGIAGLFLWLSVGFMLIGRVGAEVGVSQSRGRGDAGAAYRFSRAALCLSAVLGILYGSFIFFLREPLIGFFEIQEAHVAADTIAYMAIMAFGIPASYIAAAIDGTFVASGNSRTPFLIGGSGLALNMVLTPVFVFPLQMGVVGAAVTSVICQYIVLIVRLVAIKRFKSRPFEVYSFRANLSFSNIYTQLRTGEAFQILKLTWPICLEHTLFPLLTMVTTRFEVSFGAFAASISRVGTQVESLSWLVGAGFGAALTAFVGQNFGAGKMERISQSFRYAAFFLTAWGVIVTAIMWFGGNAIFAVFMPRHVCDLQMRSTFMAHIRILAASQIFANLEFVASNAFRGRGQTVPPSVINIASNVIMVPLAYALSRTTLGLLGIWVARSFTTGLRGVCAFLCYLRMHSKRSEIAKSP